VAELPTSGRVWMVDPLDGTKCFIDRDSTDFCVMIGFCIDGSPVMGVIMEPSTGKLWKVCMTPSSLAAIHRPIDGLSSPRFSRPLHVASRSTQAREPPCHCTPAVLRDGSSRWRAGRAHGGGRLVQSVEGG
jgi:fructose-1,6-bisphosphatase/inositol monophosphatase family enzyme